MKERVDGGRESTVDVSESESEASDSREWQGKHSEQSTFSVCPVPNNPDSDSPRHH